jgi:mono/diheme cytochrome c family protein
MIWLLLVILTNVSAQETSPNGELIFAQSCSVGYCHGAAGSAGRGPRLRGRRLERSYVEKVTRDGIPDSAMPGWKGRLSDREITAVVDYVMGLASASEASQPANPMPPGEGPASAAEFAGPPEARRGQDLFFDSTRTPRCSGCHALGGRGAAIGPDLLTALAREAPDFIAAVRNKSSKHVLIARLTDGDTFPALRAGQKDEFIQLYDLTAEIPVLRTLQRSEIRSLAEGGDWRHEAVARPYSDDDLAAILPFLQWQRSARK